MVSRRSTRFHNSEIIGSTRANLTQWREYRRKRREDSVIQFTHRSFPVRTCIGVLPGRELESAEAATLSFALLEDLLEEAATCLDRWSFFVIVEVEC